MTRTMKRKWEEAKAHETPGSFRLPWRTAVDTFKDRSQGVDLALVAIILVLVVVGLVMMYSASYAAASYQEGDSAYYIKRQLIFAVIGAVAMFVVSLIPVDWYRNKTWIVLILSYVLLVVVLFLPEIEHVHRWIKIGSTTFQPSEIMKFGLIMFCAKWVDEHYEKMHTIKYGLAPFLLVLGVTAVLLVLEPHLSCTVLVILICFTMMYVGGTKFWQIAVIGAAGLIGLLIIIKSGVVSYSGSRIAVWLDPFNDGYNGIGAGWQNIQSLYAISSGGLLGQGLGNSREKYLYLPEPQNDFIFAIICEEIGFVGAILIIALFFLFVWRGFTISINNRDKYAKMMGIGITAQVGWQALINFAVVTKLLPNTGISLPFFSYGGTSLVMLMMEIGILLGVSRQSTIKKLL